MEYRVKKGVGEEMVSRRDQYKKGDKKRKQDYVRNRKEKVLTRIEIKQKKGERREKCLAKIEAQCKRVRE